MREFPQVFLRVDLMRSNNCQDILLNNMIQQADKRCEVSLKHTGDYTGTTPAVTLAGFVANG